MLTSHEPQARNADGTPAAGHPAWKPHPMQGWTPGLHPQADRRCGRPPLHRQDHHRRRGPRRSAAARRWPVKEGIFVGITSGATFAGALKVAAEAPKGANILCMLPDTGERYLSTPLFENVPVDMTEEEQAIWRSTPLGVEAAAAS